MKRILKNHANLLTMSIMVAAMALAFLACEEKGKKAETGGGGVKLLESVNDDYYANASKKFEYDDKNRIVKIVTSEKTITLDYKGDDLVSIQGLDFKKNGNTITIGESIITIDNDGYILKTEYSNNLGSPSIYQYKAGNLIKIESNGSAIEYTYDDKKSPFFNCKTPKWFLLHQLGGFGLKNNIAESSYIVDIEGVMDQSTYSFEYDSEGYPTKSTHFDSGDDVTTTFTYRSGTKGANQ